MTIQPAPPDRALLVDMAQGYFRGKVLCAAVRLGIPDALQDAEKTLAQLAAETSSSPETLYRLLRTLASFGIIQEVAPERFGLTPLGRPLCRNAADSVWASMIFWADLLADSWTYLAECVRTGGPGGAAAARKRQGVQSRWSMEPDAPAIFRAVFSQAPGEDLAPYVSAHDFSQHRVLADLGGAGGGLLAAILKAHPRLRGILVDRTEAVEEAAPRIQRAGLADRCRLLAGDLLESVSAAADAYILKAVLHGYEDDNARRILRNCRGAMTADNRLLVIEVVLPERVDHGDPGIEKMLMADLNMLAVTGGRERSASQWTALLKSSDFDLLGIAGVPGKIDSIIEAIPR